MIQDYVYDINIKIIEVLECNKILTQHFVHPTFYDEEEFHLYHVKFANIVYRLFVKSNNKYIGYCYLGLKDSEIRSPYSSPFSMIYLRQGYKIADICMFINAIKEFTRIKGYERIQFTLPPEIYFLELINSLSAAFFSEGFQVQLIDINNYFDLDDFTDKVTYLKEVSHKVRKNYKNALKNGLYFTEIQIDSFKLAYDVIVINRKQMGYPLKISERQMRDLLDMKALNARCFVVKKQDICVAAAIVFDVTKEISQVVYWGDNFEYRNERPMDLLTTEIINTYKLLGKRYLDIGPSSENGIIKTGLAEFKKTIGCKNCTKLTFEYRF